MFFEMLVLQRIGASSSSLQNKKIIGSFLFGGENESKFDCQVPQRVWLVSRKDFEIWKHRSGKLYAHIKFDDGDSEDFTEVELMSANSLMNSVCLSKQHSFNGRTIC